MGSESDTSACGSSTYSDSDLDDIPLVATEDSDETDAPCDSDDGGSPRSDNRPSSSQSRKLVPKLGMSQLTLGQPRGAQTEPMTERLGIRPPRMRLPTASNFPPDLFTSRAAPQERETVSSSETHHITVELMSQAFVINRSCLHIKSHHSTYNGTGLHQQIIDRCSTSLGIAPEELQLHQVRSLDSTDLEGCSHICVSINKSTFSLSGLEEMLRNHKSLTECSEKLTSLNEQTTQELREVRHQTDRWRDQFHSKDAELLLATQKNIQLEQEVVMLRDKLRSASDARNEAYQSLQNLRQEFESLRASLQPGFAATSTHDPAPSSDSDGGEDLHQPLPDDGTS